MSLTEFKTEASRFVKALRDSPQFLVLTQNGRASAVVQDFETYQRHD
ncbi:MAG: type II toxin-antitoxin system Phd/YefM family antitoxin [Gammaproteobacteria bacterium]